MNKICRHKNMQTCKTDNRFDECIDCSVLRGNREDPHFYVKEYYMDESLQIFKDGIIRRGWYWNIHSSIWDKMNIDITKFNRVLEVGCGVGRLLWSFHRNYDKDCVGVEISHWGTKWVERTLGFNDKFMIHNANFENIDKRILGKFDFILSCHVLEHFEDAMTGIEDMYDLLNDDGYIYLVVPDKEHQKRLHIHNWVFSPESIEKWLTQAGFKDIKVFLTEPHNGLILDRTRGYYLCACGRK